MARTHSAALLKPRDCLTRTTQVSAKDAHDQPLPAGDDEYLREIEHRITVCADEAAHDRAGLPGSHEDKGREAAEAALSLALTLRTIRRPGGGVTTGF